MSDADSNNESRGQTPRNSPFLENPEEPYARPNYYHGLLFTDRDWQSCHDYHTALRWLHNRTMHTPGVVHGLAVTADEDRASVHVEPGLALDAMGRELLVTQSTRVEFELADVQSPPDRLYLVASWDTERPAGYREEPLNPGVANHAWNQQVTALRFQATEPESANQIELARVKLTYPDAGILAPVERDLPGDNSSTCVLAGRPERAAHFPSGPWAPRGGQGS